MSTEIPVNNATVVKAKVVVHTMGLVEDKNRNHWSILPAVC
jgi:hypothetical protein